MNAMTPVPSTPPRATPAPAKERAIKEQVVLVLQGGGALGAYQAGVYQALMEGGIEPDWVIGTSIGAINGALIAGNEPANRIARLREFWDGVGRKGPVDQLWPSSIFGNAIANMSTIVSGIPGFDENGKLADDFGFQLVSVFAVTGDCAECFAESARVFTNLDLIDHHVVERVAKMRESGAKRLAVFQPAANRV